MTTPTETESLWGEIPDVFEVDSVKYILEEQALALKKQTNGLLYGHVKTTSSLKQRGKFRVSLEIVAPSLDNYRYEVLSVTHGIETFPARISSLDGEQYRVCKNEAEFKEAIRGQLQSERVRKVIRGLLGMMRPATEFEKPFE